jgi:HAD superfamily hydrolase (TIGR01509 family)
MHWIFDYQLFLFDFDGLLVNTEEIHFLAYRRMLANHGIDFSWDFDRYCRAAHYEADALKIQVYQEYPTLLLKEPDWSILYAEKKQIMVELLQEGGAKMMPGAEKLLTALADAGIKRCVVTHSPDELVNIVRSKNPILNTIPYWITRNQYTHPKPHPECYIKAIENYAKTDEQVIGFEDTPRGISALLKTRASPVIICTAPYPEIPSFLEQGVRHYSSLAALPEDLL